ncbi:long-chain-fatty-acid--CoA ligase [Mycobacterium xenopi]|uniref:Long-chain-fatty-acid--CoA ligase FadD13 n=1 Tax=Mycobacterium xenopi TaxID=1789 RepID=A0AAD1GZW9_MYCXE|nr:long-chain fatty acid--CoA ligase [Mycobacterium xenopi]MDA3638827.1 long-chain fatty acid--CoA ligase [Mycobacterium xenopi]MDA3657067.1 long-chain fatty acid--CoA ligase [Mycobacterium xenopi]MDA3662214.1 long-chain fatty acid--CoA ligase [Mycobacterium xenopi]ORX22068.1 long-chain fatty acid--CoA ligase [Mycobacterium xenopi]SPX93510.1 fatty-acid-CoA ligase [Mycobacterium xenopi]
MSFNLAVMLREARHAHPDKPLCHIADQTFSYAQVDEISGRVATSLRNLGVGRGDKVAVQLPNLPHFLFAYFAILKVGAVMVPLNPLLRAPEVNYHLNDSDSRLLITFETFAEEAVKGADGLATYVVNLPGNGQRPKGTKHFDELYFADDTGEIEPTNADDTAVIIYTSGTTGKPKGAELTHFQLFMNCTVAGELFDFRDDDVGMAVLPMFHVFGLSSVLNVTVRFGGTLVLVPRFDAHAVIEQLARHRCTIFSGVPTMYFALLQADTEGRDLSALRVGISGGAAIPGEVIRAFEEKFPGVVILEGYGLSETASTTTFNISAEQRKVLSIGKPIWGVEVCVVDENDNELPPGPDNVGEIVIRGHNVMKGYYKKPEATAEAFRHGWFHTGDLAYRDEDGYFFIVDRKKDLVIRGGYNVYPREIEEVLFDHPGVAAAAVIGKPDEKLGQEVLAFVVPKDGVTLTADEVIAHCKQRLAAYKYPREVRIIDELPMGPTGKVLKKELRP